MDSFFIHNISPFSQTVFSKPVYSQLAMVLLGFVSLNGMQPEA